MTNQNIANVVVAVLKETDVDGEMMEFIINQVGMRDQMIKQLTGEMEDEVSGGMRHCGDDYYNDGIYTFTEGELIEFTRMIVGRTKDAAEEAVKHTGIDFGCYVEIELNNRELSLDIDEDGIYDEIVNNIGYNIDADDDDSIKDEMLDVLTHMKNI